jgi:DNA segregation ATPase FtsK/SpoIIIE, S-DNA-T family
VFGADQMVVGLSDEDLGPIGIDPAGPFVLSGPPGSGRSTALAWLRASLLRARPDALTHYFGNARSPLGAMPGWTTSARSLDEVAEQARELAAQIGDDGPRRLVMIEGIGDFLSGPADSALVDLIKAVKRTGHLLIAESESSAWSSSWPLLAEVKSGRSGLALQPETTEGDLVFRTPFPRITRGEFPPGRGLLVTRGRTVRVQLPLR